MCGIAGVIGAHAGLEQVRSMTGRLSHRGPDDRGDWYEAPASLGHTRLSILDLSPAGHQPMHLDQYVITFNGEIYNFAELRNTLPGEFKSQSDTEVLLHLYREHGDRCVERLNGMFAFAIWDRERRRLFAARDHLGIKPFYYRIGEDGLAFASELDALLAGGSASLDRTAIVDYLSYGFVPAPKTIYAGVHKLPAAHSLVWQDGRVRLQRYWTPRTETRVHSMDEAVARLDELLTQIVPQQLVSDVPIGLFLSGGIDSATLACYAGSVNTFTLGFDVSGRSEVDAARRLAAHLGLEHQAMQTSAGDLRAAVDTIARTYGEPFGDSAGWSSYLISRLARREVTVALSGEGGDELFCGYARFWRFPSGAAAERSRIVARILRRLVSPLSNLGRSAYRRAARGLDAAAARMAGIDGSQLDQLLAPGLIDADYDRLWAYRAHWQEDLHPTQRMRWLELNTSLPEGLLTKIDRASMAHSLEVRPPLLDHRLVEFALTLAPQLLVDAHAGQGKLALRHLIAPRMPPGHLQRPKQGFGLPMRRWLRDDRSFVGAAIGSLVDAGILRRRPPANYGEAWSLLVLARWLAVNGRAEGAGPLASRHAKGN